MITDYVGKGYSGITAYGGTGGGWDEQEQVYFGRSYADSPDIDGKVWFASDCPVRTGSFVRVRITDVYDGELLGEKEEEADGSEEEVLGVEEPGRHRLRR